MEFGRVKIMLNLNCQYPLCKHKRAFTLVELIISIAITIVIVVAFSSVFKMAWSSMLQRRDIAMMDMRFHRILRYLDKPIFYTGLGIPYDQSLFHSALGDQGQNFFWDGPVSTSNNHKELRLFYGKNRYRHTIEQCVLPTENNMNDTLKIHKSFNDRIEIRATGYPRKPQEVFLVPEAYPPHTPFVIREKISDTEYRIEPLINTHFISIPKGASVYLLYAAKVIATGNNLRINRYRGAGKQPVVRGVIDARFEVNHELRTVTGYFLIRGMATYSSNQPVINRDLWPSKYYSKELNRQTKFRRRVYKAVWGLPNCETFKL